MSQHDHSHDHNHDHDDHDHKHGHDHHVHGDHDHKHCHNHDDHKHNHPHDDHDHKHGHDDQESGNELSLEQKLAILMEHWIEHNKSHQGTYESWAIKASDEKLVKTAALLKEISSDSVMITKKLEKALQSIKG